MYRSYQYRSAPEKQDWLEQVATAAAMNGINRFLCVYSDEHGWGNAQGFEKEYIKREYPSMYRFRQPTPQRSDLCLETIGLKWPEFTVHSRTVSDANLLYLLDENQAPRDLSIRL